MINKIKSLSKKIANIDARTIGLLAILIVAISVTYSSAQIIHKNFLLQQEITKLQQENALQAQINKNQNLKNQYYTTDAYLDIAARRYFNKAAPGEKVYLVPQEVAMANTIPLPEGTAAGNDDSEPKFIKNWRLWIDFLSGKPIEIQS